MPSATSSLKSLLQLHDPVDPTARLVGAPIVRASFESGAEFLDHYRDDGPAGEVALPTRARHNDQLVLEIMWPGLPNTVFVRAQASPTRLGLLARLHREEARTRDFLVRAAHGGALELHQRRHHRFCVRFPLGWRGFGSTTMRDGTAWELSAGGILVTTSAPPPIGEGVALRLRIPGLDLVVTGTVRHHHERQDHFAFGAQFAARGTGEQHELRRLLRAFNARGVVILDRPEPEPR
jgi:hypothetical protein